MRADLARLREMERKATLGPWVVISAKFTKEDAVDWRIRMPGLPTINMEDAALIGELRNALPALADRLERLESILRKCDEALPYIGNVCNDNEQISAQGLAMWNELTPLIRQALAEPAHGEKER